VQRLSKRLVGRLWLAAILAAATGLAGCERKPSESAGGGGGAVEVGRVPPPAIIPDYSFAEGVREEHPEIAGFLQEFLEICLAGDYAGYRKLASRQREPESRERFQRVYHAISSLMVETVQRLDRPDLDYLSDEIYLVVVSIKFHPDSGTRLRRRSDKVAFLVIREEDQWRMLPAPSELQPAEEPPTATSSAPASTTAPSYPWDEEGDF